MASRWKVGIFAINGVLITGNAIFRLTLLGDTLLPIASLFLGILTMLAAFRLYAVPRMKINSDSIEISKNALSPAKLLLYNEIKCIENVDMNRYKITSTNMKIVDIYTAWIEKENIDLANSAIEKLMAGFRNDNLKSVLPENIQQM